LQTAHDCNVQYHTDEIQKDINALKVDPSDVKKQEKEKEKKIEQF